MKCSNLLFMAGLLAINIGACGTLYAADDDFDAQLKRAMEFSLAESSLANQLPQDQQNQVQNQVDQPQIKNNDEDDDDELKKALAQSLVEFNPYVYAVAQQNQAQQKQVKQNNVQAEEKRECVICLEDLLPQDNDQKDNDQRVLGCMHVFHNDCINNWLQGHDTCPICRHKVKKLK